MKIFLATDKHGQTRIIENEVEKMGHGVGTLYNKKFLDPPFSKKVDINSSWDQGVESSFFV